MSDETDFLKTFVDVGLKTQEAVDQIVNRHGVAAKGAWEVRAGVIPSQPEPNWTKRWSYTSVDHETDRKITEPQEVAIFSKLRAEAMDYFLQISYPQRSNWADRTLRKSSKKRTLRGENNMTKLDSMIERVTHAISRVIDDETIARLSPEDEITVLEQVASMVDMNIQLAKERQTEENGTEAKA